MNQSHRVNFSVAVFTPFPDALAMPKRDPNQQAARAVEKITGSNPVRGEDLVSSEELKRKFREAKKELLRPNGAKRRRG